MQFDFANLLNADTMNYIPLFSNNQIYIDRDEKMKRIVSNKIIKPIVINDTCDFIIQQCNGKNRIKDIIDNIIEYYANTPPMRQIQYDVLNTLYSLWMLKLLKWIKGQHPFNPLFRHDFIDKSQILLYKVNQPNEIMELINLTRDYYLISSYNDYELYYTKKNIARRFTLNTEHFFSLYINKNLSAAISLLPCVTNKPYQDVVYFRIGYLYDNIDNFKTNKFLLWCCNWFLNQMRLIEIEQSISIYFEVAENELNDEFFRIANHLNMRNSGRLKKDINNYDVLLYEIKVRNLDGSDCYG